MDNYGYNCDYSYEMRYGFDFSTYATYAPTPLHPG